MLQMPCNNHKILVWGEISRKKTKQYKQKYIKSNAIILQVDVLLTNMGISQSWIQTFKYSLSGIFHSLFFLLLHVFYFCTCSIQSKIVITCTSKHSLEMHCTSTCYIHCEMDTVHSPLSFSSTHYIIFYKTRSVRTSLYTPSNGIIVLSQSQLGEVYQLHRLNED